MEAFTVKTITPVHIGNGRFLQSKTEYVFGKENIGVVDEAKVLELIGEDKIADWVSSIEKGQGLVSFLAGFGIKPSVQKISGRTITYQCDRDQAMNQASLKEQLFNGKGLPYIPGSSIKGAIRSALFSTEVRESGKVVNSNDIYDRDRIKGSVLEKKLFGFDPNHDVFRFLQIGDAYFERNSTVAMNMVNINIKQDGAIFDTSKNQLIEAIGKEKQANFGMKLNHTGMDSNLKFRSINQFPDSFASFDSLFQTINNNTRTLLEEEIEFWMEHISEDSVKEYIDNLKSILKETNNCSEKECLLRMGHGSGYVFISGNLLNHPELISDDDYAAIVNTARPGNIMKYQDYRFPKTRRIDEYIELLGFVKMSRK